VGRQEAVSRLIEALAILKRVVRGGAQDEAGAPWQGMVALDCPAAAQPLLGNREPDTCAGATSPSPNEILAIAVVAAPPARDRVRRCHRGQ